MSQEDTGAKELVCKNPSAALEAVVGRLGQITPRQHQAIGLILAGCSLAVVARNLSMSRATLHNWLRRDEKFIAALRSWRTDMAGAARARLMGLSGQAIKAIHRALEAGDAKVALNMLKGLGVLGAESAGSDDMEERVIRIRRIDRGEGTRRKELPVVSC